MGVGIGVRVRRSRWGSQGSGDDGVDSTRGPGGCTRLLSHTLARPWLSLVSEGRHFELSDFLFSVLPALGFTHGHIFLTMTVSPVLSPPTLSAANTC